MNTLIRLACGNTLPLPEAGKARMLTPQERRALTDFARKNAPPHVAELVARASWLQRKNSEWFVLLDDNREPVGVEVHQQLLEQLFG